MLRAALAVAVHYGIVDEVKASIDRSTARLRADGYLSPQGEEFVVGERAPWRIRQ